MLKKKIIVGSGVVALLARKILGPSWDLISHGPSRFYAYNIPFGDNFLIDNQKVKERLSEYKLLQSDKKYDYKCGWSFDGNIVGNYDSNLCDMWLPKIFGYDIPSHYKLVLKTRMNLTLSDVRISKIYKSLVEEFKQTLDDSIKLSQVDGIDYHTITIDNMQCDYDKIICTTPFASDSKSKNLTVVYGYSKDLDFEGYQQLWVCDPLIEFFKVVCVKPHEYTFSFSGEFVNHVGLIRRIVPDFEPIGYKTIPDAIPCGERMDIGNEKIIMLGASAENDYAVDITSSIIKIVKHL